MVSERTTTITSFAQREQEFEDLFAVYVERLNKGEELHPQEILARHPDLGEELLGCLQDYVEPDAPPETTPARTLGDYTLRREIARGGMGIVFDAWQNSLDRRVALKILPVGIAANDRAFERFMREARAAARLDHPGIVRVHGMGVESNTPYYAMEHVAGRTLAHIIEAQAHAGDSEDQPFRREGALDYAVIATVFAEVADGLQHAHEKGVIHRDIKPPNLILDPSGRLRILDFGLARFEGEQSITLSGDLVGTPVYMSPEQARRHRIPIDHRTDVYSLGATLYELLTLRPPFQGDHHSDTLRQIIEQDPQPARRFDGAIPRDLETIVLKCLRKDPRDRYQSAADLATDLRRFAAGDPIAARPFPRWRKAVRWFEQRAVRIGVSIMIIGLVSIIAYLSLQPQELMNQRLLSSQDMEVNNFWDMRPSPDGSRIAFTRMGLDGALCYYDLEAGEITQLTDGEEWIYTSDGGPAWSPDGRRIACAVGEEQVLTIVDVESRAMTTPAGTDGMRLTPMDWSPDGKSILCEHGSTDGRQSLVVLSPDSGAVTSLIDDAVDLGEVARYSHGSRHIAFSMRDEGDLDVFIMAADGTNRHRVTEATTDDQDPVWSPEDDAIVYLGQSGLWSAPIEDGGVPGQPSFLRATDRVHLIDWPREAGLFYVSYEMIFTAYALPVDPGTGMPTGEIEHPLGLSEQMMHRFVWSPDMTTIAYSTYRDDGLIHIYSLHDRSLRSFESGFQRRPSNLWWSRDGARVLYMGNGASLRTVVALDPVSGKREHLFPSLEYTERIHTRPDGGQMVFYRWRNGQRNNGQREIVVADIGNREGVVIADEQEDEIGPFSNGVRPAYSPDGTQILFVSNWGDLWLAAADGSSRRLLAQGPEIEWEGGEVSFIKDAVWHPDGTHILFTNWADLLVVDVATGEVTAVPLRDVYDEDLNAVWQWSPDGARIAFTGSRGGGPELWVTRNLLTAGASD